MLHRIESLSQLNTQVLAQRLGEACLSRRRMVTSAESCTGGGVASAITDIAGSSGWFETGYVTYSNAAKTRLLDVPSVLLETHGAVSRDVVLAMAEGACRDSGAHAGVAVSGVAGPGGGSEAKPVGTVWFAWGSIGHVQAECFYLSGDRLAVRQQAVRLALAMLLVCIDGPALED
ncbi:CinA family protein [Halomonas halocynthiae]|uniref:CinA family protein n=1 Tax=Halomonas halocynthiae TaxID=176290 RepID=UPI0004095A11|nr:CinA family protein [Halomonas halocynthiae]